MVVFKDGIIHIKDEASPKEVFEDIRTSVYDNLIPVIKVVGFKTVDVFNPESVRASDRHNAILENMIELSGTFSELVILPYKDPGSARFLLPSNILNIEQTSGEVTAGSAVFKSNGKKLEALNKTLYLYNALQPVAIRLVVTESTGFVTMERSVEMIRTYLADMDGFDPNSYFPLNNEFSLINYVRILPPVYKEYKYTLRNGMTDEILNILWDRKRAMQRA